MINFGIDRLAVQPDLGKQWGNCGLLANQASVDRQLRNAWAIAQDALGDRLKVLFGPQHGYAGTVQYNMIETDHGLHRESGLPVYSLYGEIRKPTSAMLAEIDTLVIDLQITGCRVYTWKATVELCLQAAQENNKKIVILDRPNPLGGRILEGRTLDDDARSFVGAGAMPMRHGLTLGEAAQFLNQPIGTDLEVITLENWDPDHCWKDLNRPWILTSPMLPHEDPLYLYPGTVLLEGTRLSEGRGTTLPFQLIGAPYIEDSQRWMEHIQTLAGDALTGARLREVSFLPTWNKWQDQECGGIHVVVDDHRQVRSFDLTLAIIRATVECYPDDFQFEAPGYEYDFENPPINLLVGSLQAKDRFLASDFSLRDPFWHEGIDEFIEQIQPCLLYPRTFVNSAT